MVEYEKLIFLKSNFDYINNVLKNLIKNGENKFKISCEIKKIKLSKYLIWFKDNKNIKNLWMVILIDKLKIWNEVENVKKKLDSIIYRFKNR